MSLPTHTDFEQMLRDMYEYSKTSSSSVILCNDDPTHMRVGFVVAIGESAVDFCIALMNYDRCFPKLRPEIRGTIKRWAGRTKFCDKKLLESIFEPDLKARKEIKKIEKLRPIINSAFDRLEV